LFHEWALSAIGIFRKIAAPERVEVFSAVEAILAELKLGLFRRDTADLGLEGAVS